MLSFCVLFWLNISIHHGSHELLYVFYIESIVLILFTHYLGTALQSITILYLAKDNW